MGDEEVRRRDQQGRNQGPRRPWLLVGRVLLLFLLLDVGLRLWGVEPVYRLVTTRAARRPAGLPSPFDREIVDRVAAAVTCATRYYYRRRPDCLPKAMSLFYLLRRRGVPVELCWGVRKYPFAGHTWVEYQGEPVAASPGDAAEFHILSRTGQEEIR